MAVISRAYKKQAAGITWGHETLASHRVSLLQRTRDSRYYSEPIVFERMFSKLRAGVVDAPRRVDIECSSSRSSPRSCQRSSRSSGRVDLPREYRL